MTFDPAHAVAIALTATTILATLWAMVLTVRRTMDRVDRIEDRLLRGEPAPPKTSNSNWQPKTPHRSCGCACHGGRP